VAALAPNRQPDAGGGSIAERHRRAAAPGLWGPNGAASYVGTPGAKRRSRGSAEARYFPAATFRIRSGQLARSRQGRAQEGGQLRPLREAPRDPATGRVPRL
jgi:hypothetical protein